MRSYIHSARMKEKRAVLHDVAADVRRTIGQPAVKAVDRAAFRLAA